MDKLAYVYVKLCFWKKNYKLLRTFKLLSFSLQSLFLCSSSPLFFSYFPPLFFFSSPLFTFSKQKYRTFIVQHFLDISHYFESRNAEIAKKLPKQRFLYEEAKNRKYLQLHMVSDNLIYQILSGVTQLVIRPWNK